MNRTSTVKRFRCYGRTGFSHSGTEVEFTSLILFFNYLKIKV